MGATPARTAICGTPKPWTRHAELGDQARSHDYLHTIDAQQRCEVVTYASFDIGAQLKLLVHEQRDLVCDLANCPFTHAIQLA